LIPQLSAPSTLLATLVSTPLLAIAELITETNVCEG
jgi:hypothetical protein